MKAISADSIRVVHPLSQAGDDGSIPISALQLHIHVTNLMVAKRFNKLWHSRLPTFNGTAQLCFAAIYANHYYGVAIWGNPVARLLPQQTWLELKRLAIPDDAPRNMASRMLAVMARMVKKLRPEITTLVSYQDTEVHTGVIYKAAGWYEGHYSKETGWNRPNRYRPPTQAVADKIRWQRDLRQ